jgi:hypothetical protein
MTTMRSAVPLTAFTRQILYCIGQGGVATDDQLTRRFWSRARPRSAYRQLYRLVAEGYLLVQPWSFPTRKTFLYALTEAGAQALGVRPPHVYIGWPRYGEMAHLILGQETRLLLETRLAVTGGVLLAWRAERLLRHLYLRAQMHGEIPDAQADFCLAVGDPMETVDVEIDGQYYGQMLARKAAGYGAHPRRVLWACLTQRAALVEAVIAPYPNVELLVLPPTPARYGDTANG